MQEVIPLDEKGGELKLTVAYYYLPSGKCVHRLKDATDWGVDPQIVVPMDAAAEEELLKDHYDQELFHRPVAKATTMNVGGMGAAGMSAGASMMESAPTTLPTTQPSLDVQFAACCGYDDRAGRPTGRKSRRCTAANRSVPPIAMTISPATAPTTGP